jgi:hypothetical protein
VGGDGIVLLITFLVVICGHSKLGVRSYSKNEMKDVRLDLSVTDNLPAWTAWRAEQHDDLTFARVVRSGSNMSLTE